MFVEVNIDEYLSDDEKKQICADYFRSLLYESENHKERILSNLAYNAAFAIMDSVLTPEMMEAVREKVSKHITDVSAYGIFRKKDVWGGEDSAAYVEVKNAVLEHKHLINPLVKKAILDRDYVSELPEAAGYIGDCIVQAIKKGLEDEQS